MSGVTSASRAEQLHALRRRTLHEIDHLERLLTTEPTVVNHSRLQKLRALRDRLNVELGLPAVKTPKIRKRRPPKTPRRPSDLPAAPNRVDQLLAALGVTARDVKEWGVAQGHLQKVARGRVGYPLVQDYAEAHGRA